MDSYFTVSDRMFQRAVPIVALRSTQRCGCCSFRGCREECRESYKLHERMRTVLYKMLSFLSN